VRTQIDHLVIAATDIERGVQHARSILGVELPQGGVHPKMGTHNHLMRLGEEMFLEVIAINPDGEPPSRPRWFGFDDPAVRERLEQEPAFLTWVVNTDDIHALMKQAAISFGVAEPVSRGNLNWQFGLPRDGRLLAGGMLPYVIEWETETHPASGMADLGCTLQRLTIEHPNAHWLTSVLDSIGAAHLVEVVQGKVGTVPVMTATIMTPDGEKTLSSLKGQ